MARRKKKPDPNSILYRVREAVVTFDGEFTNADMVAAIQAPLKGHVVGSALSALVREGVIRVVRREPKAPCRAYFEYVPREAE